jgi:hypothetical protein
MCAQVQACKARDCDIWPTQSVALDLVVPTTALRVILKAISPLPQFDGSPLQRVRR